MTTVQSSRITPHLWFNGGLREAVEFYTALFPNSRIESLHEVSAGVTTAAFVLDGQRFMAMSSDRAAEFTPAVSFFVNCETQDEVDRYWDALTDGGEEQVGGWLVDRFGVSWQIIPSAMFECLSDPVPERAQRAMNALLGMRRIDIAALRAAREG